MQNALKWIIRLGMALAAVVVIAVLFLVTFPPDLLRVGTGMPPRSSARTSSSPVGMRTWCCGTTCRRRGIPCCVW